MLFRKNCISYSNIVVFSKNNYENNHKGNEISESVQSKKSGEHLLISYTVNSMKMKQ